MRVAAWLAARWKTLAALGGLIITAIEHRYISHNDLITLATGLVTIVGGVYTVKNRQPAAPDWGWREAENKPDARPVPEPDADPLTGCRPVAGPSVTQPGGKTSG